MKLKEFLKDKRVLLLIVLVIASIGAISVLGIQQGLDLKGGSTIQIQLEKPVDTATMNTVTAVLDKRLNIFGVKDVKVYPSGNQNVIVEIAGVQPEDVAKIVGSNGKFEAKINNQTALVGSDITQVKTYQVTGTQWQVPFTVSLDGANRFAQVAKGQAGVPVEMYLDDELITSPELAEELANGNPSTDVMISGGAATKEEAQTEAKSVQTLLQSGALPVKVKIVGVSSVSADLGDQFINGALIAGLLALVVIAAIIILRYRTPILVVPIIITSIAELILVLGAAAVIHWNIDLAAIAGIIAAIGTGVDDQIIITDEVLKGFSEKKGKRRRLAGVRSQIKGAFFIIFAAAGTLIAAMLPLAYIGFSRGATGIGVLSGFAFTTVLGVLIGIFITRPVYAKFIEMILDK
ncbi:MULTISPECIES: preprotein translocase subunit SecD [Methanobacterium]|jgi:preprotein translocase subunit SecD|uniref:Protein-export membrane protein SecD n=1 Tax=Methanobacterium subterraneum TaxID=59277 RepID=A0A7K4DLE9_9EURY|nr:MULTISPECIES: preprotein translocase subunit SecD [Methanobacterium]AUB58971.1 preprotein translocase subunit SecD [Methanobacterium sp. MZ-A1]MCC7560807.1 preprotein translocase subunit SecD [Methanobacterium sp.]NMO08704.1 preprotein translocase subunit SecD [Methanobacterium subterraneum]